MRGTFVRVAVGAGIALAVAGTPRAHADPSAGVWDLKSDFTGSGSNADGIGPDGAWTYGDDVGAVDNFSAYASYNLFGFVPGIGNTWTFGGDPFPSGATVGSFQQGDAAGGSFYSHEADHTTRANVVAWVAPRDMTVSVQIAAWTPDDGTQNTRAHDVSVRWYEPDGTTLIDRQDVIVGDGFGYSSYATRWTWFGSHLDVHAGQRLSVWHTRRGVQGFVGLEFHVAEETPPEANPGPDLTVEATSATSTTVHLDGTRSFDADGDPLTYEWTWSGGTATGPTPTIHLPLGDTIVQLTVEDGIDASATSTVIHVVDTTAPSIHSPGEVSLFGTSAVGGVATFTAAATDAVDGDVPVTFTPDSGSTFPYGTTTVVASAVDAHGNRGTSSFRVNVLDHAPVVLGPPNMTIEATGPSGAVATFAATATDPEEGALPVTCVPASGSTFAFGSTLVTCTATDAAGLSGVAIFHVDVVDTTRPSLTVPANVTVEATGPSGARVTFAPTAVDLVDGIVAVSCSPPSGSTFRLGTTTVKCTARDTSGNLAPANFDVTVVDTTPPVVTVPSDISLEAATSAGAVVTFVATATDLVDGPIAVVTTPSSGATFPIGTTTVSCTARDSRGNAGTATFRVTVADSVPPVVTPPSDIHLEATRPGGAVATFTAHAVDAIDGELAVACAPASGSTFPIGVTSVVCRATDAHGNTTSATFAVVVVDTTSPVMTVPSDLTLEATGPGGAVASFDVVALDQVDGALPVDCSPASGATFPLGTTTVLCQAVDAHGNSVSATFRVTVADTTAPSMSLPSDVVAEATSASGAAVDFTATATDLVDGNVLVVSLPVSGSTFAIGTTTVPCTATDAAGNLVRGSFTVTVVDTTAPSLTLPADAVAEATSAGGGIVTFSVTAADVVDGDVAVACSPASGSVFPLGTTTVECTAADAAGNSASRSFTVTVRDTTPPTLHLPSAIVAEAASASGAVVDFAATSSDTVDGSVEVSFSRNPGSRFPLGMTTVECSAVDAAGNTATGSFTVTVGDTSAPLLALPSNVTAEATGHDGASVTFSASALDVVDGAVSVDCSPASGSVFPIGTTTVTCTASDADHNVATGTFTVTVRDMTAPTLTLPADISVEATGPSGSVVGFQGSATDVVDGACAVTFSPPSGSTFPLGSTTVHASATDVAGNTRTGSFVVTVRDTTAPTLTVSGIPGSLWPANKKMVRFAPAVSVSDVGDPSPVLTLAVACNESIAADDVVVHSPTDVELRAERSAKGVGRVYTLTYTATDAAGNRRVLSATVTVPKSGK